MQRTRSFVAGVVGVGMMTTGAMAQQAVQWRVEDGGNGHWYQLVVPANRVNIDQALSGCRAVGADLVSISSASENNFVFEVARQDPSLWTLVWPGATQISGPWIGARFVAPSWQWTDGSHWGFTAWSANNPNYMKEEHAVLYMGEAGGPPTSEWNNIQPYYLNWGYIVEWSADCNNDGLVDYGQILSGQLADANANGIPDICESTIVVPTQFPTIQAAIDSVPAGAARVISVLAGTYNQSFALNGKDIVVRGAPNNATILDGTGLATSVVRFTGGEPATAGIENLVIRNGTVGSLIVPSATFRVGGGLYAANSSAFVKDCRFESNRADFGGGAYLFRSSTSVQGCVFLSNTAFSEGGALQLYESSGPIVGSSFTANAAGPAGAGAASALKVVGAQTAGATVLVSDCTIQDGVGGTDTSAVEMFENAGSGATRGVLRISNTVIEGNAASTGAGGLRVIGSQDSCVLADGTSICSNTPRNVLGPFLIEGKATVCDCLADLTLDGAVNGADLGVALAAWGAAASNGAGDANHDGIVDGADLASVLASWGACP